MRSSLLVALASSLVLAGVFVGSSRAEEGAPVREAPVLVDPRDARIGEMVPDVAFTDLAGKKGSLAGAMGEHGLVLMVHTAGCPIGRKYGPGMERLRAAYAPKGLGFLIVDPAEHDDAAAMRGAVRRFGFGARFVPDPEHTIARTLRVLTTTEVFVLDAKRTLVYRGAIDDQYGLGYNRDAPRSRYLIDALDALLAGRAPTVPATTAPGCALKLSGGAPERAPLTYHNRISRILDRNCVECHREGENGPFPLDAYRDAKGNAGMIELMVKRRLMPPWFAAEHTGEWSNDRSLSERDRADLLAWVAADCPEGDAADGPIPIPRVAGWKIGKPDAVIRLPRAQQIPAEGVLRYRNITVETGFDEDKWVTSMELRASAPQVVHHILVFLRYPKGHPLRPKGRPEDLNGLVSYFAGMVPGQGHLVYPDGVAKKLPRGARLRFQIHYTPNGEATEDRSMLGLVFADGPPEHEVHTRGIFNTGFRIPPGAADHEVRASWMLPTNGRVLALMPHMHLRGKSARYEVMVPGGEEEVLLDVPRYDFNWQFQYWLQKPLDLPARTLIRAKFRFDNSDGNPANPDPKQEVRFGDQTFDEMMIGYVEWYALD